VDADGEGYDRALQHRWDALPVQVGERLGVSVPE
jgi:hypothetical protein